MKRKKCKVSGCRNLADEEGYCEECIEQMFENEGIMFDEVKEEDCDEYRHE